MNGNRWQQHENKDNFNYQIRNAPRYVFDRVLEITLGFNVHLHALALVNFLELRVVHAGVAVDVRIAKVATNTRNHRDVG